MIDQLDTYLEHASTILGKLYGAPGYVLVLLTCLAIGYFLKGLKRFPNDAIPWVVVIWGCAFNMLIADPLADGFTIRIWLCKNFLVGIGIGVGAWVFHNQILARIEDKIPFLNRIISDKTPADPAQPKEIKP
jgi:hypothetical protein